MKSKQGTVLIEKGWIFKPKGLRVKYQRLINSELVTEYSPGLEDTPMDSDVTAWRYAWKLFMATRSDSNKITEDEFINVFVVDENDNPIQYYATGKTEIFNPKKPSL